MGWSQVNSWQYSRWVKNIARNARITNPVGAELESVKDFLKFLWNPAAGTGTRPWLKERYQAKGVIADYSGDIDAEPAHTLVVMLDVAGRDLKDLPMTVAEKDAADALIAATGNRYLGTSPLYGGVGGSAYQV